MIAKLTKAKTKQDLISLVEYLLTVKSGNDKRCGLIGSSGDIMPYSELMFDSIKSYAHYYADTVIDNFHKYRPSQPLPKYLAIHVSLSASKEDTDKVDSQLLHKMYREAFEVATGAEYDEHDSLYAEHLDTEYNHCHSLFSTLNLRTKKVWNKYGDILEFHKACEHLENKYNLTKVQRPDLGLKGENTGEYRERVRTGIKSNRKKLQTKLVAIVDSVDNPEDFLQKCFKNNIQVVPNLNSKDVSGISFEDLESGSLFKGSSLGKRFSWNRLKLDIKYTPDFFFMFEALEKQAKKKEKNQIDLMHYLGHDIRFENTKKFQPRTILRITFEVNGNDYCFKSKGNVASTDNGDSISFSHANVSEVAIKASLQLAVEKDWKSVKVSYGDSKFRRKVWLISEIMKATGSQIDDLEVITNFSPSLRDQDILKDRINEAFKKQESKNTVKNPVLKNSFIKN